MLGGPSLVPRPVEGRRKGLVPGGGGGGGRGVGFKFDMTVRGVYYSVNFIMTELIAWHGMPCHACVHTLNMYSNLKGR